ncbi:MAG TPA: hypothetical protein DCM87_09935 [Planctomycetes bacterium]|nr:hypothetical protein [Planctomycetota bacterium]
MTDGGRRSTARTAMREGMALSAVRAGACPGGRGAIGCAAYGCGRARFHGSQETPGPALCAARPAPGRPLRFRRGRPPPRGERHRHRAHRRLLGGRAAAGGHQAPPDGSGGHRGSRPRLAPARDGRCAARSSALRAARGRVRILRFAGAPPLQRHREAAASSRARVAEVPRGTGVVRRMAPIEREIIRRKLERIVTNLRLLDPVRRLDLAAYRADVYRRKAVERLLQETVEAAVDINAHLLVEAGRAAPEDLYSSFTAAADLGVLAREFAVRIAPSAGLRNRLVHEYDEIDDAIVLAAAGEMLEQYPQFVAQVEAFLSRDA